MQTINKLVAVVAALVLVGGVVAQPMPTPTAPAVKAVDGSITDVQLGEMLAGMGLEAKEGTYKSGAKFYDLNLSAGNYDYVVRVGLSPNKRSVWLMANLGDLPADAPADRLKALLEAINSKTGKMQFRLTGNTLKADQPMDNVGMTPARLRREIDDFTAAMTLTEPLWNPAKWTPATAGGAK